MIQQKEKRYKTQNFERIKLKIKPLDLVKRFNNCKVKEVTGILWKHEIIFKCLWKNQLRDEYNMNWPVI